LFYSRHGERLFDLSLTILGLVVLLPLLAFIALMVRAKLGSPVLFRQVRPGLGGRPFTIYKFRTMTDARGGGGRRAAAGRGALDALRAFSALGFPG
jgi:sugar transferase EpsL